MNTQTIIETKIRDALKPTHLEVINESQHHNVPEGSQSHFKLVVISEQFKGESLVNRHRRVNELLREEFQSGLHALALHTMTPEEWFLKGGMARKSPDCMGGSKSP